MLVLTRKIGERIFIGDDIVITLIEIQHGAKVRLGIEAPKDVRVLREELAIAIAKDNAQAVPPITPIEPK